MDKSFRIVITGTVKGAPDAATAAERLNEGLYLDPTDGEVDPSPKVQIEVDGIPFFYDFDSEENLDPWEEEQDDNLEG